MKTTLLHYIVQYFRNYTELTMKSNTPDKQKPQRSEFFYFQKTTTRWMDNDIYGHVNNVQYYSFFDTVVNQFLIERGELDIHKGDTIGFVVHSQCNYYQPIQYPETIDIGMRANHIGNSSVEYGVAIFQAEKNESCAYGTFTHVFVNRASQRPTQLPEKLRLALKSLLIKD